MRRNFEAYNLPLRAGAIYILYFATAKARLMRRNSLRRKDVFILAYISLLTILATIGSAVNAYFGEAMWIIGRNIPGGPPAFWAENVNIWYQIMGTAASVLQAIASDALLVRPTFIPYDLSFSFPSIASCTAASYYGNRPT